jgi:hypothetical protein
MSPHDTALEQNEYRLVLVKSGSHSIWAENNSQALRLPRVVIPRWTRPAEQLQQAIESFWSIRSIILDILPGKNGSAPCAVVEVLSSESPSSLATANIDEIAEDEMTGDERELVETILAGGRGHNGPFSCLGWIKDAMDWVRAEVGHDIVFTGQVRQYNASASFALLRIEMQVGPKYWLKATGLPNAHEFHITRLLSELCPEFLPQRVAERRDWNAWLMEDAGQPLDVWTLPALEQAVSSMAELQKRTIGRTRAFLEAGAFDQRLPALRAQLTELVEYLNEAMMKQSSTKVPRIEKRRLWQMASIVQDACFCMEALEIPETLVHNDMNSGNILFHRAHCVFTDWCEIGVSNPFFTFQYLCLLQLRGGEDWTPRLRELYRQCWLDHLSSSQIEKALALMPLLAILSYLYGRGTWLHSVRRNNPHVESYARSLARHMNRAAQDPRLLGVLCR